MSTLATLVPRRRRSRWSAPRRLKITRSGRVFLGLTLGVGVAALNTGNNLLYLLLALQLTAVVVSGLLSERGLRDLRVERVSAEPSAAGEDARITYRLQAGRAPLFALTIQEEGLLSVGGMLPYLSQGDAARICVPLPTQRRGPLTLSGIVVTTVYPLGLFAKSRTFDADHTLWIHPRRVSAGSERPPQSHVGGDDHASDRPGGSGDLLGLRELGILEDARRVHWLKSAAAGKALRVEREQEREATVELQVPTASDPRALDAPCEAVAALTEQYLGEGIAVGLTTGSGRVAAATGEGHRHRLLELLAHTGYGDVR